MTRIMKYVQLLLLSIAIMMVATSCTKELSEDEQDVIHNHISKELYQAEVSYIGNQLGGYLNEAVSDYAETLGNQIQKKIDERNATNALFGGSMFDMAELFGTTTNDLIAKQYYRYIDYINSNMNDMVEMAMGMTTILGKHPEFIKQFENGIPDTVSLEIFSSLNNVPGSISGKSLDFGTLTLDDTDKEDWGEILMGNYKEPQMSVPAVLYTSILAVENLKEPKAVYAVYDDDSDSWDVGYDSQQAVRVGFKLKGDVLAYEYSPTQYNEVYIKSDFNALK